MSVMSRKIEAELIDSAGGARSEPGGRAQRPAGGAPLELPEAIHDRLADDVVDDVRAERSRGGVPQSEVLSAAVRCPVIGIAVTLWYDRPFDAPRFGGEA